MNWRRSKTVLAIFLALAMFRAAANTPSVGDKAPNFEAYTLDGDKVSLADLRGSVVLLNFWATWCGPCKQEMPLLDIFYRKFKDRGLVVLALTTEDSVPLRQLRPVAKALSFPLIRNLSGPYDIIDRSLPTSYVIDRAGVLRYAKPGAFDIDSLNDVLLPLLTAPRKSTESATEAL